MQPVAVSSPRVGAGFTRHPSTVASALAAPATPPASRTTGSGRATTMEPGTSTDGGTSTSGSGTPIGGATARQLDQPAAVLGPADSTDQAVPTPSYWELLQYPEEQGGVFFGRARSMTDANVLRRKGHLKEQDPFIDFMRSMHETHTIAEVMAKMDRWVAEHRADPKRSRLRKLLPRIGTFFTPLDLSAALQQYDKVFHISSRKYIPPNFAELRHIVNIAQVHASAESLKLITFDADGTLYADGHHFDHDNAMISQIISLMKRGVQVAIVTAAGYPGEAHKFETRLAGLLDAFRDRGLPKEVTDRFHIMGGECNYLLRVTPDTKRLEFVPEDEWLLPEMRAWGEEPIAELLDNATSILTECAGRHGLPCQFVRKTRAVGIVPTKPTIYEVLEDIALTVQMQLPDNGVPFCAFNGGNDVFCDVGNKSLGLEALMSYTGARPEQTVHVGDRFTLSGNDAAARDKCSVLWVANPEETGFFIRMLLKDMAKHRQNKAYIE